ncbi:THO complex subunit 2 [Lambiella insularis]|nr:THO complex subunit 2 [Lambiella insularis]
MAPNGGGKRKRGDSRTYSYDNNDGSRPSPHRPGNLTLGQQNYQNQHQGSPQYGNFPRDQQDQRGRGGRRGSRAGRGGSMRSPLDGPNAIPVHSRQASLGSKATSQPELPPPQRPTDPVEAPPAQQPLPVTNTGTQISAPLLSITSPPHYHYVFITDEVWKNWQSKGRSSIVEAGKLACLDEDSLRLGDIFQEIIRSGLDERIDPGECGSTVKDILGDQASHSEDGQPTVAFSGASVFLNCVAVLTESTERDAKHPSLPSMLLGTGISPLLMREELEHTTLEHIGLIRGTFYRIRARYTTNSLYRMSSFNLLREETEGYSKLITELFTTSANAPPSAEVVGDTFERVRAMIGAFNLDVGRALDVTLDAFAALLVKQHRFFVKFLRLSSWWPQSDLLNDNLSALGGLPKWALPESDGFTDQKEADKAVSIEARNMRDTAFWDRVREVGTKAYFEIGGRKANDQKSFPTSSNELAEELPLDEDCKWIEHTGTLPPPGNKIAAQVLGFKLRSYSSPTREASDVLPPNLIDLAALLIKIGFISLRDLYPHLWPADGDMEKVKEEKMKEKAEQEKLNRPGGGVKNALMTAGALVDDTIPNGRLREIDGNRRTESKVESAIDKTTVIAQTDSIEQLPEPSDQKVQLLRSLLCIGAIPESLFLLGRFPWLVDAFSDLPEYIHRILHHSLSKVYDPLRPLHSSSDLREQHKVVDPDQSGVPKGQVRQIEQPPRKILRWLQLDRDDESADYRFYWDEWADNIPVCQTVDDVFALCGSFLNYSGVKIGQDPALLVKLARIGNHSLNTDTSETNKARWIDLSKRLLVPALSLTRSNAGVVTEVFELIKQFSTQTRYLIYAEWYGGATSRLPDIKAAFDQVRAETKDILKRISKTNIKPQARALAKVATASPGTVFAVAIAQIESYENLVEVVVECARYFTYLGYDVLTWSLMSSLGARGRNRVQADGMLTSKWLVALSLFAGKVFKRYAVMSPTPILQYVTEQLRKGNPTDLIVLEEITSSMGGIVSDTNFNEAQVLAMAGGDLLQAQTMLQLHDKRHEPGVGVTAKRLMKSLVEPKLAGQLLISIAQVRQTCVYTLPEQDAYLKLLGNLFDEIHRVLTQYLDLLRSKLSVKDFNTLIPSVSRLIGDFGIEPNVAFWISRPSIGAEIKDYDRQTSDRLMEKKESSVQKDAEMAGTDAEFSNLKVVSPEKDAILPTSNGGEASMDIGTRQESQPDQLIQSPESKPVGSSQPWHPVLRKQMEELRSNIPSRTWEVISEPFYLTFWQLSLGDMIVPTQSYEDEINRQKKKIVSISSDRSDVSVTGTQRKDKEKKALNDLQDQLRAELKDQVSSYQQTRSRLVKEKEHWFPECWGRWDALNIALLEHCFFPRILISPVDAIYTFKMLKLLHSSGAKNFRTMGLFDQLFNGKRLTSMLFLCTAKEADNLGRFLNEILKDLGRWHADKTIFEKEAYGPKKDLPGFSKKMTDDKTILAFWDYEDFRRVLQKWHININTAFKACFTGGEYMHIRNAIVILKAVCLHFPVINWMGQAQVSSINDLIKTESREDLKIAATSLLGNLKRREKDWVLPQAFSLVSFSYAKSSKDVLNNTRKNKAPANGASGTRSTSTKPTTPQPESQGTKTLNAEAPEFKPSSQGLVNGLPNPGRHEAEDGEIDDNTIGSSQMNVKTLASAAKTTEMEEPASEDSSKKLVSVDQPEHPARTNGDDASLKVNDNVEPVTDSIATSQPQKPQGIPPKPTSSATQIPASVPARPARPEAAKTLPEPILPGRPAHSLPSRPEALPTPSRNGEQRFNDRNNDRGQREPRDPRYPEHTRNDRPYEHARDRIDDRQPSGSFPRSHDRVPEKVPYDERDRPEQNWGGEKGVPGRPPVNDRRHESPGREPRSSTRLDRGPRDRQHLESFDNTRISDNQGRSSRDLPMAPPRSNVTHHPDRQGTVYPHQDGDRSYPTIQPDRRNESSRYETRPSSQRSSRTSSPSRRDEHRSSRHDQHFHEDRPPIDDRRIPEDISSLHSSRYEDSRPPTGPRTERLGDAPLNGSNERFRDSLRAPPPSTQAADPSHGRLNLGSNNTNRSQNLQYGRLNPEVPSGPRMSNGTHAPATRGNSRSTSAQIPPPSPHAPPASQSSLPSPVVPDRQAPTGPASNRAPLRTSGPFNRPLPASTSTPSTPVAESPDVAGVHPDRLKAIQDSHTTETLHSQPLSKAVTSPVSPNPPMGPRGPHSGQPPSPVAPSRLSQNPPTGPSSFPTNDRGRGDRRFAAVQGVLQQASAPNGPDRSSQGTSIRGRGGRMNNFPNSVSSPVTSGPPTPLMPRQDQPSLRQENFPPSRTDLFASRAPSGSGTPQHAEEEMRGGLRDSELRRSARHSRSHSRDHYPTANLPPLPLPPVGRETERFSRRGEEPRDYRVRSGAGGPPPDILGRDTRRGGREDTSGRDRDRRAESDRRDTGEWNGPGGPGGDMRGGGDLRGGGDMRGGGGERRDDRERDRRDGPGRKRARGPEDGPMGFGEKRSRRGM